MLRRTVFILLMTVLAPSQIQAQELVHQKISALAGGFSGELSDGDRFGSALAVLGDLDGDGNVDLAVGAANDNDGGAKQGAVWILFLQNDGTVKSHQKISALEGGFTGVLSNDDRFGSALASLGDLNGDGIPDLAVGAENDDDGGDSQNANRGAVWILFLQNDGTVKSHQKISDLEGGFSGELDDSDFFGSALAVLGDLDDDGNVDLAVGAPYDDDGLPDRGAVWILFLQNDGTVKSHQKISDLEGGFSGELDGIDYFGSALARLGDFDRDGIPDLAVGAAYDDDGGIGQGAVWILVLQNDGTVKAQHKISATAGGFTGPLRNGDRFGSALAPLGDLDGNGTPDLVVGTWDNDAGADRGAVWNLFLQATGTIVVDHHKISALTGGFSGELNDGDFFGSALASLGDLDGDGTLDVVVSAPGNDDGGSTITADRGALWIIFHMPLAPPRINPLPLPPEERISMGEDIPITAEISAVTGISEVDISFRRGGDPSFLSTPMQAEGEGLYAFRIPTFLVSPLGVEYFIEAVSNAGIRSRMPDSGVISVPVFIPDGLTHLLAHGTEAEAYRLLSIPLDLDEKRARNVLEDDLGPYNKARWRFFEHQQGDVFTELDQKDLEMESGQAYWLLVKDAGLILDTGPGQSVSTADVFQIPLKPGWSLVGNPFNFPIPLTNVSTKSEQPLDIRSYNGSWNTLNAALQPFGGYAVFNARNEADALLINPDMSQSITSAIARNGPNQAVAHSWAIRIVAQHGRARDEDNFAAVTESAAATWDPIDRPEPLVVGDYVSVYFPHQAWGRNTVRYSTDARPIPTNGEHWSFEVITRTPGPVKLRFENLEEVPLFYEVWLVDETMNIRQDLRTKPLYLLAAGANTPRRFQLVVGTATYIDLIAGTQEIPVRYELFPNFPNPFSTATTVRYTLPASQRVSLQIYNILGERVATLLHEIEHPAGRHAIVWDSRNDRGMVVAAGIYFARFEAGYYQATQPLVVVH